jgi:hypothetical protein
MPKGVTVRVRPSAPSKQRLFIYLNNVCLENFTGFHLSGGLIEKVVFSKNLSQRQSQN